MKLKISDKTQTLVRTELIEYLNLFEVSPDVGVLKQGTVIKVEDAFVILEIEPELDVRVPRHEFVGDEVDEVTKPGGKFNIILSQTGGVGTLLQGSRVQARQRENWLKFQGAFANEEAVAGCSIKKVGKKVIALSNGVSVIIEGGEDKNFPLELIGRDYKGIFDIKINNIDYKSGKISGLNKSFNELKSEISSKYKINKIVKCNIVDLNRDNIFLNLDGVVVPLPKQYTEWRNMDPSSVLTIGDKLEVKIKDINEKGDVTFTRLGLAPLPEALKIGNRILGRVVNLVHYGVFIEFEGAQGLLHISNTEWATEASLRNELFLGQMLEVDVLEVADDGRISFSRTDIVTRQWIDEIKRYNVGETVDVTVEKCVNFGLFANFGNGLHGLIHSSELSWLDKSIVPTRDFEVGQSLSAIIILIDEDKKQISLSLKQLTPNPWYEIENKYKAGDLLSGVVQEILRNHYIVSFGDGLTGTVKKSDLDEDRRERRGDYPDPTKGQSVEVKVVDVDPEMQKIKLRILLPAEPSLASTLKDIFKSKIYNRET